jgi:hypothetical protein
MSFNAVQKTLTFKQFNNATPDKVFPLLCPVREKDWLDGWDYKMIYSKTGLIEKNCLFSTSYPDEMDTIWHVTQHNPEKFELEFLRVTPKENVVRINIKLTPVENDKTESEIVYQYTGLSEKQNEYINSELELRFEESMKWWEKSINHYLETGKLLKKQSHT